MTKPPRKSSPQPPPAVPPRFPFLSFIPYPLSFLAVAALAVAAFWPVVSGAQTLFFGDVGLYFAPLLSFQRSELLAGRIPLWNPYLLCGTPFIGNPQAWPLHPSSLLLYVFDAPRACGLIGVLSTVWGAWGTLAFLLRRGVGAGAALVASVAWAFGGAFVSKYQFPNMAQAASWLPWLLWAADGVVLRAQTGRAVVLAVCVGLSLLSAHAQMFLLQFYLGLAFSVWRVFQLPTWDARRQTLAYLVAGFLAGALLASAQLLPVIEQARASVRPSLPLAKANRFILPPYAALTNFVAPNFYGNPATDASYVARGNFWEPCAYTGVAPFLLAVWTTIRRFRSSPDVRFWTIAALLCVWLALGRDAGLFAIAFYGLPGLSKFHDAARFLHPATFALACLAAHGLDALGGSVTVAAPSLRAARFRRGVCSAVILAAVCVDLLPFSRTLNPLVNRDVWTGKMARGGPLTPNNGGTREPAAAFSDRIAPPLLGAGGAASPSPPSSFILHPSSFPPQRRLYHTDETGVWRRYVFYKSYGGVSQTSDVRAFLGSLAPNTPAQFGLYDANGYEPVRRADIATLLDAAKAQTKAWETARRCDSNAPAPPIFAALGVGATANARGELRPLSIGEAGGRATFWTHWRNAPTARAAAARVAQPDWDGVPVVARLAAAPVRENAQARSVPLVAQSPDGPDEVTVALPAAHPDGVLVLADTFAPGWTATVDGRPVAIRSANGAFRAVPVGGAAKNVMFRYNPVAWRAGLFASLLALGIITAASVRVALSKL